MLLHETPVPVDSCSKMVMIRQKEMEISRIDREIIPLYY